MARVSKNNAQAQHEIMRRRAIVSEFRCKGFSLRKIHSAMTKKDEHGKLIYFNPENGKEWSFATIQRDVDYAEEQWRNQMVRNTNEIKNRQLEELELVRSACWGMKSPQALRTVIASLQHEAKITGIEAPQVLEHISRPDEEHQLNLLNECLKADNKKEEMKKMKKST